MHRYIPNTEGDRAIMLEAIGVQSIDDLFDDVPPAARNPQINLPPALSEPELMRELQDLSGRTANLCEYACFLGAGA